MRAPAALVAVIQAATVAAVVRPRQTVAAPLRHRRRRRRRPIRARTRVNQNTQKRKKQNLRKNIVTVIELTRRQNLTK
jgi:hypothetical protein